MFNNLTNFFNLIDLRRFKKTPEPTDVFPMGTRDAKYNGGYKPTFIQWQDLVANICEECGGGGTCDSCCDITMTPITATLGARVNFLRLDRTPGEDIIVPGVLAIARGDSQPIFNSVTEVGYNFGVSPADTEWNSLYTDAVLNGFGTLTNFSDRTYGTFVEACNNQVGVNVIGLELVCHVISTNQYFLFVFDAWTMGGVEGGAGFGYTRTEVFVTDPCVLTFSDGTTMTTAPVIPPDTNTWNVAGVAFVDPQNGNNATAVVGDGNLPFQSIATALNNATKIILLPANYAGNVFVTQDNIEMFAMKGVKFTSGGIRVVGTGVNKFDFKGYAVFEGSTAEGFRVQNSNAVVNFDCDYMDNRLVCWVEGDTFAPKINFNCNWIRCSSFNGAGYGVRLVGGSDIKMNIKFYYHAQHANIHARNSTTGRLVVNCPDIRIINNYTSNYGSLVKRVVLLDSLNGAYIEINGNLINDYSINVGDASCLSLQGWAGQLNEPKLVINGDLISVNNRCIYSEYRSTYGKIQLNGNLISGTNAIYDGLTGWGGATNQEWIFNGSIIDSQQQLFVTRGKKYFFKDNAIHINEDGTGIAGTGNVFNTAIPLAPVADAFLYFYNCEMQTNDLNVTIETFKNFNAQFHVATINTQSNVFIGTGVIDEWNGFVENPELITPKIK